MYKRQALVCVNIMLNVLVVAWNDMVDVCKEYLMPFGTIVDVETYKYRWISEMFEM